MIHGMKSLEKARQEIEERFVRSAVSDAHSVGIGFVKRSGRETGEIGVVVKVGVKMDAQTLENAGRPLIPRALYGAVVDVQQAPVPTDQRLHVNQWHALSQAEVQAEAQGSTTTHRSCLKCPILGGAQIAPNKPWVGTLGGALMFSRQKPQSHSWAPEQDRNNELFCIPKEQVQFGALAGSDLMFGALTNAHVTGMNAEGQEMFQPTGGRGEWFGKVYRVVDLHFDQRTPNFIDAAVIDTHRTDGKYANGGKGTHTVVNRQIELGQISPSPSVHQLGMKVQKTGRTTGTTHGRITEVQTTTLVNYGSDGTALFQRQFSIEGDNMNFSAGGDSGSLIFDNQMRPVGLLFAGGGNVTIANPIEFVLQWCGGRFY